MVVCGMVVFSEVASALECAPCPDGTNYRKSTLEECVELMTTTVMRDSSRREVERWCRDWGHGCGVCEPESGVIDSTDDSAEWWVGAVLLFGAITVVLVGGVLGMVLVRRRKKAKK